jgi:ribosomal protein S18 acetylase RimI-like enzyme
VIRRQGGAVPDDEARRPLPDAPGATLRAFVWDDWPGVLELWQGAGPGIHLGRSDSTDEIRKKWSRDPELFLVAQAGSRLVGAVLAGYDGRRGLVYHLAVAPDHRRRGIGRALMDEIERRLASKGCVKSYLLATPDNYQAVAFYRKLGWEVMDMVLMGKEFA